MSRRLPTLLLLGALVGLLAPAPLTARYIPPRLVELLGTSDLVAAGVIAQVRPEAFMLRLERVIAGDPALRTVRIERFENWTCSRRWRPYKVGQRLVVMVQKTEHPAYEFALRSAGWESEFPVTGSQVLLHGYHLPEAETALLDGKFSMNALPLDTFASAVRDLRRCWSRLDQPAPRADCPAAEIAELAARSWLHGHLAQQLPNSSLTDLRR